MKRTVILISSLSYFQGMYRRSNDGWMMLPNARKLQNTIVLIHKCIHQSSCRGYSNRMSEAVNKSEVWSVIADTTPTVVAQYVELDSNLPIERLVDIKDINNKTSDRQAQEIVASVDRKLLDKDSIAFQSYDFTGQCQEYLRDVKQC